MKETKIREYYISEKAIKKALKLEGDIKVIELWNGLSPNDVEQKISRDRVEWCFTTKETKDDGMLQDSISTKSEVPDIQAIMREGSTYRNKFETWDDAYVNLGQVGFSHNEIIKRIGEKDTKLNKSEVNSQEDELTPSQGTGKRLSTRTEDSKQKPEPDIHSQNKELLDKEKTA